MIFLLSVIRPGQLQAALAGTQPVGTSSASTARPQGRTLGQSATEHVALSLHVTLPGRTLWAKVHPLFTYMQPFIISPANGQMSRFDIGSRHGRILCPNVRGEGDHCVVMSVTQAIRTFDQ